MNAMSLAHAVFVIVYIYYAIRDTTFLPPYRHGGRVHKWHLCVYNPMHGVRESQVSSTFGAMQIIGQNSSDDPQNTAIRLEIKFYI